MKKYYWLIIIVVATITAINIYGITSDIGEQFLDIEIGVISLSLLFGLIIYLLILEKRKNT